MMTGAARFNTFLFLLALMVWAGCKTPEERQQHSAISSFRLHLETNPGANESVAAIEIAGAQLFVSNVPFLDETSVAKAAVVDTRDGGFAIQVQYDRHGSLVLDAVTTENRGRHFGIFTQFGPGKLEQKRWLGAPYIGSRISGGVLIFTPNATRQEAEQIVQGLNNVAKKLNQKPEP
jgi:preprotein translocase subunit SecD